MLSLRQLRYALAVWRERSFIRAAERLHVSQPAISGQVRQLENDIGFDLFRRTGQGVETTEIGRTFLMQAEEVYFGAMRLSDTARQLGGGPAGGFAVGISSGIAQSIVPILIGVIKQAKPLVRLEVTTTTTRRINQLLVDERLDIGITVEVNPRALPSGLTCTPVANDEMVVILPPDHRLQRRRRPVDLKELVDEPLIMNELAVGYGELVLSLFADQSIRPNIAAISDNVETIKAMVHAGAGIAIVPKLSVASDNSLGVANTLSLLIKRPIDIMLVRRAGDMSPAAERNIVSITDALTATLSN
jgi:DNA-binding transcriptional LysR family regulator